MYNTKVEGPLDLGAMQVAFVETRNQAGELYDPGVVLIEVSTGAGDFLCYLTPGSKGIGKCEYAPLQGQGAVYRFRVVDSETLGPYSMWAICDTSLPLVPAKEGFVHKCFIVTFIETGEVEPPVPTCPQCAIYEQRMANIRVYLSRLTPWLGDIGVAVDAIEGLADQILTATGEQSK